MDFPIDLDGVCMRPGEPIGSQLPQAYLHLTTGDRVPLHFTCASDVIALGWWLIGLARGDSVAWIGSTGAAAFHQGRGRKAHPDTPTEETP